MTGSGKRRMSSAATGRGNCSTRRSRRRARRHRIAGAVPCRHRRRRASPMRRHQTMDRPGASRRDGRRGWTVWSERLQEAAINIERGAAGTAALRNRTDRRRYVNERASPASYLDEAGANVRRAASDADGDRSSSNAAGIVGEARTAPSKLFTKAMHHIVITDWRGDGEDCTFFDERTADVRRRLTTERVDPAQPSEMIGTHESPPRHRSSHCGTWAR